MKSALSAKSLSIAAGVLLAAAALSAEAGRPCSESNVRGSYGYTVSGHFYGGVPAAAVGVVKLDGEGGLTAKETANIYGTVSRRTLTGTYSINTDCTGSATFGDGVAPPYHVDVVFVSNRSELMIIQTDAGTVITGSAKRQ